MAEDNPYTPPTAELVADDPVRQATLGARFWAAIVDGLISTLLFVPIMYYAGYWDRAMAQEQTGLEVAAWAVLGFVVFVVIHGYLLATRGQTVGKMLLKTRIVSKEDEKILPIGKVLGLRYLPISLAAHVPFVGPFLSIIDVLFIFGRERQCIHDRIAGTIVIKA
jgi:uncharacterized RDD family membrane protein YckC